jgi:hypothetical protein
LTARRPAAGESRNRGIEGCHAAGTRTPAAGRHESARLLDLRSIIGEETGGMEEDDDVYHDEESRAAQKEAAAV